MRSRRNRSAAVRFAAVRKSASDYGHALSSSITTLFACCTGIKKKQRPSPVAMALWIMLY